MIRDLFRYEDPEAEEWRRQRRIHFLNLCILAAIYAYFCWV